MKSYEFLVMLFMLAILLIITIISDLAVIPVPVEISSERYDQVLQWKENYPQLSEAISSYSDDDIITIKEYRKITEEHDILVKSVLRERKEIKKFNILLDEDSGR